MMKKFGFGNLGSPLAVLLLIIAALFSNCRKESFDALQQPAPTVFSPLTLGEAKSWYGTFQSFHQYDGTTSQYFNAIPDWDYAFIDSSKNGNPMVVVPIRDSSIRAASQGRTDLKMIFYRTEQDTIGGSLVLYSAD